MAIDDVSHELGRIAGSLEGIEGLVQRLDAKMDAATIDRDLLSAELRTLKHDQRNIEQKVEMGLTRSEKLDEKIDKNKIEVGDRLTSIENWQQRMIGRVSAFGIVGTIIGWILLNFGISLFQWAVHGRGLGK